VYVDEFRQTAATTTTKTDKKFTKQAPHHFINYQKQPMAGSKSLLGRHPDFFGSASSASPVLPLHSAAGRRLSTSAVSSP
jgi:hypothetical protein